MRRRPKPIFFVLCGFGIFFISLGIFLLINLSPVDSGNKNKIEVVIDAGTSTNGMGEILKSKDLIRNELFFLGYIKLNKINSLKAGVYEFSKDMSFSEIINLLKSGSKYNPDEVVITFREGLWIKDYIDVIVKNTNNTKEEVELVFNDLDYMNTLIDSYWFLEEDILNSEIYYPLEGYLAPNTYHFKNKDVSVSEIIEVMLDQTEEELLPYKTKIEGNVHYYITMASMLELEGTNSDNKKMIAGVFENRLKAGDNLGSDVTTYYAFQHPMTSDLTTAMFNEYNPYNTRSVEMRGLMPVGPICNPGLESISSAIDNKKNDYLYFVADKHGNIFFTKTYSDHLTKVNEIKNKGDWIW